MCRWKKLTVMAGSYEMPRAKQQMSTLQETLSLVLRQLP
jgi:hypothetical protein